jgi:DNA-binding GntR family transcriptional regulator
MASLVETVCDHVWKDVVAGRILPGDQLDEAAIAKHFGISRTPVREAAHHLCGQDLLRQSSRGFVLPKLSLRELRELLELAGELEAACARLAARRITDDEAKALRRAQDACANAVQSKDAQAYSEANAEFHGVIYAAARNAALVAQLRNVDARCNIYRRNRFERVARRERSLADHYAICDAIVQRQSLAAHEAMIRHAQAGGEDFAELVADSSLDLFA